MSDNDTGAPAMNAIWTYLVRDFRARGMSYRELAEQCGVSRAAAYNWFRTTTSPQIDTVAKLANVLGYKLVLVRK